MKREDRIILRFSIAVSIRCNTDDNPLPENPTPEQAADYIQKVLEILFAKTGKQIYVYPLKHPVSSKFPLIIICDGQPNDDGYSGTAAEADLRGIKLEYSRRGVQIFAAAIGDDRPNIERIYGDGYLDITDLNDLPVMLTSLIARHLPH